MRSVFEAGLAVVEPEAVVRKALAERRLSGATVLAIGKAAPGMARGASHLARAGLVISDHLEPIPKGFEFQLGGHPVPNEGSVVGGRRVVELLGSSVGPVLFLISGGASALCELPSAGLHLSDIASLNEALLRSGADIVELNTVRKHLSQVKGGRLAQLVSDREALTLVLSDVVGSPPTAIGSGPTVPDPTSFADALEVLERHGIDGPPPALAEIRAGASGQRPETLKASIAHHDVAVVGDGRSAANAAVIAAREEGLEARVRTAELVGNAATMATAALDRPESGMTFYAGETTVEVTGSGRGGRNQHAALTAAVQIEDNPGLYFGALATDGIDGPTGAAGAIVDAGTVGRGRAHGLAALDHLERHDAHPFLAATGDLLGGGPTGTNVGDLWVVWRS